MHIGPLMITSTKQHCQTPVRWIEAGYFGPNSNLMWHREDIEITQMRDMGDMFSESCATNPFHRELFVMDAILNRAISKQATAPTLGSAGGKRNLPVIDPDWVAMVCCFKPENLNLSVDWKFCIVICFILADGVFHCVQVPRREVVGIVNTMI
jgi:hypothetical protein